MKRTLYVKTPLVEAIELTKFTHSQIFLKMEALQPSGSFKNRGIGYLCAEFARNQNAKSFVSSSGGNAGLAVAYSGKLLNVPVQVIVPKTSLQHIINKIKQEGADVIVHGDDWAAADVLARKLSEKPGCFYIPPFDHPLIWEGHASMINEIKDVGFKPDAIVLSVGGGGLLCGVVEGLHTVGWSDIPVFTAETEGAASFAKSVQAEQLVTLDSIDTIATSLGAKKVALQAFEWAKRHPIFPLVVTDKQALNACYKFLDDYRMLVEPACGASLAIVYDQLIDMQKYKNIVVIVCGGCGVTYKYLNNWANKLGGYEDLRS